MLTISIVALIVLCVLAVIVLRYGADAARCSDPRAKLWRRLSLAVMGVYGAFLLFMGVGEMAGGDFSGVIHLVPAAVIGATMYLATRRPLESGIALLVIGGLASIYYAVAVHGTIGFRLQAVAIGGLPWLVSGILLLVPELGRHGGPHDQVELGA